MVANTPGLTVTFSPAALASLDGIWDWNAHNYGDDHADRYVAFLRAETSKLENPYVTGNPVPSRSTLSYITIRKRRGSQGHVAVYELIGEVIQVLNYYHTSQNWQQKVIDDNL